MKRIALVTLIIALLLSTASFAGLQQNIWDNTNVGSAAAAWAVINSGTPPTSTAVLAESAWPDRGVSYYVGQLTGWITVPADGDYIFYCASDDNSELLVSPNDDPESAVRVAYVSGWTGAQAWTAQPSQASAPITLAAGQIIAINSAMNEGTGGDNFGIGWKVPGSDVITLIPDEVTSPVHPTKAAFATKASPANGATRVVDAVLGWEPVGVEAPTYDVYLGLAPDALELVATGLTEASFNAGSAGVELGLDTTYYWRVDVSGSEGFVWSFSTESGLPIFTSATGDAQPVGAKAQLKVEATSVVPTDITYQWFRLNFKIGAITLPEAMIPGAESNVLDIAEVTSADEGEYYCVATNEYGDTASPVVFMDAQTGLIHQWTFNDSPDGVTVPDVVGGADGVLINNTGLSTFADGQLTLGNDGSQGSGTAATTGDFVDLPNGLVSRLTQMTIEVWTTWNLNTQSWSRVYDFGISNGGEGVSNAANGAGIRSFYFTPKNGGSNALFEYRLSNTAPQIAPGGRLPQGEEVLLTQIHDDKAGRVKAYINGMAVGGMAPLFPLNVMDDKNNWLGRSQWGDPLYVGSFNELRMYDTALSAEQVAANYLAGPDEMGVLPERSTGFTLFGDLNNDGVYDFLDVAMTADKWLVDSLNKAKQITDLNTQIADLKAAQ
jgi:hypothetical protein